MSEVTNQALLLKLVHNISIDEMRFPLYILFALNRSGIHTIGELCQKSKLDLLKNQYLHYRAIARIEKILAEIGLNLRPTEYQIATRNNWKTLPLSDVSISFIVHVPLSEERYIRLKCGNIPTNMDQWFIYYEQGKLHFYRYTGLCIFSVELDEGTHYHRVQTYVYNLDNIKSWRIDAKETIKLLLEQYLR